MAKSTTMRSIFCSRCRISNAAPPLPAPRPPAGRVPALPADPTRGKPSRAAGRVVGGLAPARAVAPTGGFLIAARGVQGIAGAMLVPSTLALLMDTFPEDERAGAIGSWTAWTGIATVIGPLGGGALVQAASWRWIFAINLAPVVITLVLLTRLPQDKRTPGHVDVVGAVYGLHRLGVERTELRRSDAHVD